MALHTTNIYGDITIADDAVAMVVAKIAKEVPGVAELVSRRLSDNILILFGDGVNVEAVVESLKSAVTYNVEQFTGMRVKSVDVHVLGLKL